MNRVTMAEAIAGKLGKSRLVWAGIRGDDVEPFTDIPQLDGAFSLISRYGRRSDVRSESYEALTGRRVDPEVWDMDDHLDAPETKEFRHHLLRALSAKSYLIAYRPSAFLSSIVFARQEQCEPLNIFASLQSALEHKPWVETAVAKLGIARIPWRYIADEEQLEATSLFDGGALVLRRSRTSGGEGIIRVDSPAEVAAHWPHISEAFVSVAPYIAGGIPVNIGATVWRDGVTVHHPSVQLIGIDGLVTREFGYCGNDFGAARELDPAVIDEIEDSTIKLGKWLGQHGYLGSFGVDFLVHKGRALFTEINPRFQGSTHASAQLDIEAGQPCLPLEHVAAWLKLPKPDHIPLRERVADTPDFAHIVVHWPGDAASIDTRALVDRARSEAGTVRVELDPGKPTVYETGSAILRWTARRRVTTTGYELRPEFAGFDAGLVSAVTEGVGA